MLLPAKKKVKPVLGTRKTALGRLDAADAALTGRRGRHGWRWEGRASSRGGRGRASVEVGGREGEFCTGERRVSSRVLLGEQRLVWGCSPLVPLLLQRLLAS